MSFIKKQKKHKEDSSTSKKPALNLNFNGKDFEFILKTLQTASIGLKDLEQAVITVRKLQETYKSLLNQQN
jgi:hypothetical protein